MSKELVISASSHERRVAILEEGQLVEIYIEREKEFALVGSIYKGRVTRVLPGMQSAFVDIGLDGDAFLYVSDVFENLEDYDHGHGDHGNGHAEPRAASPVSVTTHVEVLPGETIGGASAAETPDQAHERALSEAGASEGHAPEEHPSEPHGEGPRVAQAWREESAPHEEEQESALAPHEADEPQPNLEAADEPQPDSNHPPQQNFSSQYNPTQKYGSRQDRGGQDYGRGGDRGRGGRFGRRGGGRRGGRPQGGPRNLPPSKYASPQGGQPGHREDSRGPRRFDNRGGDQRRFEPRRPDESRPERPQEATNEEPFLLPGESLAKYRERPAASAAPPVAEPEAAESHVEPEENSMRGSGAMPTAPSAGSGVPRRSTVPSWLLADAEAETGVHGHAEETAPSVEDTAADLAEVEPAATVPETLQNASAPISEEEAVILSSGVAEAKHEETQEEAEADALAGGAVFEDEDDEEAKEETAEEIAEKEDVEEHEELSLHEAAEAEADAAHESALQAAALEEPVGSEAAHLTEATASGTPAAADDAILLPGETRAPRPAGAAPREDFPRESARIGSDPRSRFQRPFRSGGHDRGNDRNRGRDNRGGRPDRRGGRPPGPRFERRGPGGPSRGYRGHSGPPRRPRPQLISEMLRAGQDVVVQIAKEPLGKKGARITSHIALPGRFLVYMPTIEHIGVSRKIDSAENRSRLRRLVGEARGNYPGGFIVRTAAGGATDEEIRTDIDFLGKTWNEIKERNEQRKSPALLHRDLNLVERILRDYVSDDFTGIWIDSEEEYGKIVEFVSRFQPKLVNKVKLYSKETPIFEEFGIQHELDKALRAKVWLKSGGYIVINHTEALVAIDVNTGKFVGKGSTRLEDTIVKTNLEAVKEIVRQIRLRDLGGIIVVDFIDMEERRNREKVLGALQQALEEDKAPSKALSFNEFGLVCITRKRTKQALERVLCQPCPYCTGSGMVKSIPTLCYEIQSEAHKMAIAGHEPPNLTLRVHPEIAKALKTRESMLMDELEQTTHKHVIIQSDATLHWEQYDIY